MAVTFTRTTRSYSGTTDTPTTQTTTLPGTAIRVRGDPHRYSALGLVESKAPTLLWIPTTYGDTPEPGDEVVWRSETYTARDVEVVAPDGVTIAAKVIVEK